MKFIHHRLTTLTLASVLGAAASTSALAASTAADFKTYDSNGDGKPEAALNEVQRAREIGNTENFMKQNNCAAG